jgi:hypothetical protein
LPRSTIQTAASSTSSSTTRAVVLHGYPPGCEGLDGAKEFYRGLWRERPGDTLVLDEVVVDRDCLSISFTYGDDRGETRLRLRDGRVIERWQGRR